MDIEVVKKPISLDQLKSIAHHQFVDLVKAVVDVEQEIMVIGGEHHVDERDFLMENEESKFENLWGIDLYPERTGKSFVELESAINLKLSSGSRGVYHPAVQEKIIKVVERLILK
ncbi:MAG: DUF5674 family protein [Patescibacteria group bacterium]